MSGPSYLDIVLKEYELHRTELRTRFDHTIQALGFVMAGVITAFGLSLKTDYTIAFFLVLPWFTAFMTAVAGIHFTVMNASVSYMQELEERLAVLDYERSITAKLWRSSPYKNPFCLLIALVLILLVIVNIYPLVETYRWAERTCHSTLATALITGGPILFFVIACGLFIWGVFFHSKRSNFPSERKHL